MTYDKFVKTQKILLDKARLLFKKLNLIKRIIARYKIKHSGINFNDFKKLVEITKKLENLNIKGSTFNVNDLRNINASNN